MQGTKRELDKWVGYYRDKIEAVGNDGLDTSRESPLAKFVKELELIQKAFERGEMAGDVAESLVMLAVAMDEDTRREEYHDADGDSKAFAYGTIATYLMRLRLFETHTETSLGEIDDAGHFNELIKDCSDGLAPGVKSGGLADSTLEITQCAAKLFYRFNAGYEIDPEGIVVFNLDSKRRQSGSKEDMFEVSEISELRKAALASRNPTRDRAILELLIFTGQRIRAIITLKIGDVEIEDGRGYIRLNEAEHGLKGATKNTNRRPIFGAKRYLMDWIDAHPHGDDPEAWLFIGRQQSHMTNEGEPLQPNSVRTMLKRMAKRADVTKPVNPHNFRHYFARTLKLDYGLEWDEIADLMGHRDGLVTKDMYGYLDSEDRIKSAERKLGFRDQDRDTDPLGHDVCPNCGRAPEPEDVYCRYCGEHMKPGDGEDFREDAGSVVWEGKGDAEDEGEHTAIDDAKELADDDNIMNEMARMQQRISQLQNQLEDE